MLIQTDSCIETEKMTSRQGIRRVVILVYDKHVREERNFVVKPFSLLVAGPWNRSSVECKIDVATSLKLSLEMGY